MRYTSKMTGRTVVTERRDTYVGTTKLLVGRRYRFTMYDTDLGERWELEATMEGFKKVEPSPTAGWITVTEPSRQLWRADIVEVEAL